MAGPDRSWFDSNFGMIVGDMKAVEGVLMGQKDNVSLLSAAQVSQAWHKFVEGVEFFYVAMGWH